ncbi:MAG: acyl-CoA thioesterase [Blastomonas sp.]
MARPDPLRLEAERYPVSLTTQTRFQDMDVNGHLNNVAYAALFESARVRMNRMVRPWLDRPANERTMLASVSISYLREGHFPDDVVVCSGIGHIGTTSWVIEQAMFQHGQCIATADSVIVCRTDNQAQPLRAEVREQLETMQVRRD